MLGWTQDTFLLLQEHFIGTSYQCPGEITQNSLTQKGLIANVSSLIWSFSFRKNISWVICFKLKLEKEQAL